MNNVEILQNSTSFANKAYFVYNTNRTSSVKIDQELSDTKNSDKKTLDKLEDQAIISRNAMKLAQIEKITAQVEQKYEKKVENYESTANQEKLTPEEKKQVEELKAIDAEVKSHERAHIAAAGGIGASAPSYTYQKGPDGENYAVAGQVQIKSSGSSSLEETISEAKAMEAAALAPGNPSTKDLKVANKASQIIAEAKDEKTNSENEQNELNKENA